MGQMRAIPPPSHSTRHTRARAVAREAPWRHNGEVRNTHHVLQALAQFSSFQGAWRQTAHWHVQGCVGKAVSPRRRVTQKLLRRRPSPIDPKEAMRSSSCHRSARSIRVFLGIRFVFHTNARIYR